MQGQEKTKQDKSNKLSDIRFSEEFILRGGEVWETTDDDDDDDDDDDREGGGGIDYLCTTSKLVPLLFALLVL